MDLFRKILTCAETNPESLTGFPLQVLEEWLKVEDPALIRRIKEFQGVVKKKMVAGTER